MTIDHTTLLAIADRAIAAGASNLEHLLNVAVEFGTPTAVDHEPAVEQPGSGLLLVKLALGDDSATLAFTQPHVSTITELLPSGTDPEDVHGQAALENALNRFVAGITQVLDEFHVVGSNSTPIEVTGASGPTPPFQPGDLVLAWDGTVGGTSGKLYWILSAGAVQTLMNASAPAANAPADTAAPVRSTTSIAGSSALGRLADVQLEVTVELGRSRIPIKELLALDEGGVVRLGRSVGEPVDLLVNGLATARGEIVVVDGRLGLRVTELVG